jgi:predicted PurR-regulated permease PerM
MNRLRDRQQKRSDDWFAERFATQFAQQWAQVRAERRHDEEPQDIEAGESNFARAKVPYGVDLAAAWSWRFLAVAAAGFAIGWTISRFQVIVLPLVIALLLTALAVPLVDLMQRTGLPRGIAAFLVVVGGLALIALLLTFVGQQISQSAADLAKQVADGLEQIRLWLRNGPLKISDSQLNNYLKQAQDSIAPGDGQQVVGRVTEVGAVVGHFIAGFFLLLFASYFFLAQGSRIWTWVVRIFPRGARERADSSGRVAWSSLTAFVRATVLVALVDAVGITIVALILKVPLAPAIGVLVFLGAFVPLIGAAISGSVAVLVALVAHGPVVALIMLAGVIGVQQIEAHVLQPFLLGRFVSVHPLGVIIAIAAGALIAGIPGALVAVPLVAALNAVVLHLADTAGTTAGPAVDTAGPAE